jgi:hypothetical protein
MGNRLKWDVFVSGQIPVVTDDLPPGATEIRRSPMQSMTSDKPTSGTNLSSASDLAILHSSRSNNRLTRLIQEKRVSRYPSADENG